jgi:hypothetical protein
VISLVLSLASTRQHSFALASTGVRVTSTNHQHGKFGEKWWNLLKSWAGQPDVVHGHVDGFPLPAVNKLAKSVNNVYFEVGFMLICGRVDWCQPLELRYRQAAGLGELEK